MSKKLSIVMLALAGIQCLYAQEKASLQWYGFVRSDMIADTRKICATSIDLFSFYPMYQALNADGEDLNATPSMTMMSITSRIGLDLKIPTNFLGTQSAIAKIETDFGGSPTYMLLRIRQAYSQLFWKKTSLLVGQTWHPMFTYGVHPQVLSLNTGALFQPFNRSPQLRLDYQLDKIKLTGSVVYQMQYTSAGPSTTNSNDVTSSYNYQRQAMWPDAYVGAEYQEGYVLLGAGFDYKTILPQQTYLDDRLVPVIHLSNKLLSTPACMLYGSYTSGLFSVRAKGLWGQNLTEHSLIGGFAITPDNDYIPYGTLSSYVSLAYGKKHQVALLGGYTENLGPSRELPLGSKYYGFGVDKANTLSERIIGRVYRVTPTYSYQYQNWKVGAEVEYTAAAWGNRSSDGAIVRQEWVKNTRFYGILAYTF